MEACSKHLHSVQTQWAVRYSESPPNMFSSFQTTRHAALCWCHHAPAGNLQQPSIFNAVRSCYESLWTQGTLSFQLSPMSPVEPSWFLVCWSAHDLAGASNILSCSFEHSSLSIPVLFKSLKTSLYFVNDFLQDGFHPRLACTFSRAVPALVGQFTGCMYVCNVM